MDKETDRDTEDDEDESCATVKAVGWESLSLDDEDPIAQLTTELPDDEFIPPAGDKRQAPLGDQPEPHRGVPAVAKQQAHGQCAHGTLGTKRRKNFCGGGPVPTKTCMRSLKTKTRSNPTQNKGEKRQKQLSREMTSVPSATSGLRYLTGLTSHYESMHGRLKSGYIFKEHIDKAISLKSNDPMCYYLLGRWCYDVSSLGWLERKAASAMCETPPTATVDEALQNFLKTEELSPGYSKTARLYIAKCYKDLGNNSAAQHLADLASKVTCVSNEDINNKSLEEMLETQRE
ncbi:regulator of microtubule dynamics protein 3-like isoform X2 [Polyodon spathula]|nr:regulator of microtubule dynamics protein 3-like isoform X2 [Polyodon spathula]XP_041132421.1 regulator of microtubule dynamics protein 3-like isoform X2 [Polyodon spathula]